MFCHFSLQGWAGQGWVERGKGERVEGKQGKGKWGKGKLGKVEGEKSKRRVTSKDSLFHHHHPNFYDFFQSDSSFYWYRRGPFRSTFFCVHASKNRWIIGIIGGFVSAFTEEKALSTLDVILENHWIRGRLITTEAFQVRKGKIHRFIYYLLWFIRTKSIIVLIFWEVGRKNVPIFCLRCCERVGALMGLGLRFIPKVVWTFLHVLA